MLLRGGFRSSVLAALCMMLLVGLTTGPTAGATPSYTTTQRALVGVPLIYGAGAVASIAFGSDGTAWVATDGGLFRRAPDGSVTQTWGTPYGYGTDNVGVGPADEVWFQAHGQLWRSDAVGNVTDLPAIPGEDEAADLTVMPDGSVWFTHGSDEITHLGPDGAVLGTVTIADPLGGPASITHTEAGVVWFTTLGTFGTTDTPPTVGKIDAGVVTEYPVDGSYAGDIIATEDGVFFGQYTTPPSLTRVGPGGALTPHPLPDGGIAQITDGPDGELLYTDPLGGRFWSYDPDTSTFAAYRGQDLGEPIPIAVDATGSVWLGDDDGSDLLRTNDPTLLPTGGGSRFHPLRSDAFLAWETVGKNDPDHTDVFARPAGGGPAFKVNPTGTSARLGGIEGSRLAYQSIDGRSSDIALVDLATMQPLPVPEGVNTKAAEYAPSISGDRLLFGRITRTGRPMSRILLSSPELSDQPDDMAWGRSLGLNKGYLIPNDVAGDWVSWTMCQEVCDSWVRNVPAGGSYKLSRSAGNYDQYGVSVSEDGHVWAIRSYRDCRKPTVVVTRTHASGYPYALSILPAGTTSAWTNDWTNDGTTEVQYDQVSCTTGAGTPMSVTDLVTF